MGRSPESEFTKRANDLAETLPSASQAGCTAAGQRLLGLQWEQLVAQPLQETPCLSAPKKIEPSRRTRADAVVGTRLDLGDSASAAEQADLAAA